MSEKNLFIPLKTEHYNAFEDGEKIYEMRPYGPRWNEKTCHVGRGVTLSHGYGTKRRMDGFVEKFSVVYFEELPNREQKIWREIYPDKLVVAMIWIGGLPNV